MKNMLIAFLERCFLNCNVNHSNTQLADTVEDLFNVIFAQVNIPWDYLDKETEKRCKSIKVLNSYFKSGTTVKDAIDRVCQLALLNIFYRNGIFVVGRCV